MIRSHAIPFALVLTSLSLSFAAGATASPPRMRADAAPPARRSVVPEPRTPASSTPSTGEDLASIVESDAPDMMPTRSVGLPWQGQLPEGVLLQPSETMRYINDRPPEGHFYGTAELVGLLTEAAEHVAQHEPGGAPLTVGDLSRRGGGDIISHRSHENGRDVDLGFYMVDDAGRPVTAQRYHDMMLDGRIRGRAGAQFDTARNWRLVESMLSNESLAKVQYIFVARTIRDRLLAEGRRVGASPELLTKAETILLQPSNGSPHRDHFHVRIYCPEDDSPDCQDVAPYWPSLAEVAEGHDMLARVGRAVRPGI
jgi:penicillin-insensitive murein endopeptidase